eukprot:362069-Chlamydomonas_euryale.AAC.4
MHRCEGLDGGAGPAQHATRGPAQHATRGNSGRWHAASGGGNSGRGLMHMRREKHDAQVRGAGRWHAAGGGGNSGRGLMHKHREKDHAQGRGAGRWRRVSGGSGVLGVDKAAVGFWVWTRRQWGFGCGQGGKDREVPVAAMVACDWLRRS